MPVRRDQNCKGRPNRQRRGLGGAEGAYRTVNANTAARSRPWRGASAARQARAGSWIASGSGGAKVAAMLDEPATSEFCDRTSILGPSLPSIPTTPDNKLLIDFRLYELGQILQRLLPAEIASLYRNDVRQAFLNDV